MTRITRSGVAVEVPSGWEAELTDHPGVGRRLVLHMTSGPLPGGRSDFGGDALARLGDKGIFVSVLEYDPSEAGVGLFQRQGVPSFVPSDFAPNQLHNQMKGQTGAQKFFSYKGRTFCAYVVIARDVATAADTARVNNVLRGFTLPVSQ